MRDPKIVLKQLRSLNNIQSVTNIYKNLYNPEFYKIAYQNIYSKLSQMTPASDGSTIDGMSERKINNLIKSLRDKTYQPTLLRNVKIPKKTGGERKISIPSFNDKLVQEIIRMILEALYEPHFSESSHGFRPKKSCHTALKYAQQKFGGTKWWVTCDIKDCFDNINHVILLNILKKRIREQKFIHLINLFLKTGYMCERKQNKTYSGIHQGSIIGPILFNIYFNEFDKYMETLIKDFNKGTKRKLSKEYNKLASRTKATKKRILCGINIEENKERYKQHKKNEIHYRNIHGVCDNYDPNFRRLSYVRYADDFLIGVVSSKEEAIEIKNKIQDYLKENLKLELNLEKIKIIHNSETVRFLSYDLSIMQSDTRSSVNGKVGLWLPFEIMKEFIIKNRYGKYTVDSKTGKHKLKGIHRPELLNLDELEILRQYNAKIRGFYNYFQMASNVSKMGDFNIIWKMSFFRTIAGKYKTSCRKLFHNRNYFQNKQMGITYKNKFNPLWNGPFKVNKDPFYDPDIDNETNIFKYFSRTSLIKRMEAHRCEFCGDTNGPFEVHHVRKLKDLKNKKHLQKWERLLISRNRKTIVLCISCHKKLHAGKL